MSESRLNLASSALWPASLSTPETPLSASSYEYTDFLIYPKGKVALKFYIPSILPVRRGLIFGLPGRGGAVNQPLDITVFCSVLLKTSIAFRNRCVRKAKTPRKNGSQTNQIATANILLRYPLIRKTKSKPSACLSWIKS